MQYFETQDFYLASFLVLRDFELVASERINGLTTFSFFNSEEIIALATQYYGHCLSVDPVDYSKKIRDLKAIIHANRVASTTSTGTNNEHFKNKTRGNL